MFKVLIIFGSKSDSEVFNKIIENIKKKNVDFDFRICSAHKTPEFLDEILKKQYDLIIAGAGLSAALPGVIASKTNVPVIGIPVSVDFNGLDALLSILQMPAGIPVLCAPVNASKLIDLNLFLKAYVAVNIVGNKENKVVKKCTEILDKYNVSYTFSEELDKNKVNLYFFNLNNYKKLKFDTQYLVLNTPILEKSSAKDAVKLTKIIKKGLWLGLNNGTNIAIACLQLLHKKETEELRKEFHDKVIQADKELGLK